MSLDNNTSPFKGLDSYDFADYPKFGGRDKEIKELYTEVINHNFTLIYGKSGVGKSSLLKAGLYPTLLADDWLTIYVRVRVFDTYRQTKQAIADQIAFQVHAHFDSQGLADSIKDLNHDTSLWEYFNALAKTGGYLRPVVIFDQFEEVFIAGNKHSQAVRKLLYEIACLAENWVPEGLNHEKKRTLFTRSPRYKVLVGMREDFLPQFQNLSDFFPSFIQSQYRLSHLTGENAVKAVEKTAHYSGIQIARERIEEIVKKIVNETNSEYIPELSENIGPDSWKHSATDPAFLSFYFDRLYSDGEGTNNSQKNLKSMLAEHYDEVVKQVHPQLRENLETNLLSHSGQRLPVPKTSLLQEVPIHRRENDWSLLVDNRIIKTVNIHELRHEDTALVELIHDILASIVSKYQSQRSRAKQKRRRRKLSVSAIAAISFLLVVSASLYSAYRRADDAFKREFVALEERNRAYREGESIFALSAAVSVATAEPNISLSLAAYSKTLKKSINTNGVIQSIYLNNRFYSGLTEFDTVLYAIDIGDQSFLTSGRSDLNTLVKQIDLNGNELANWKLPRKDLRSFSLDISQNQKQCAVGMDKGLIYLVDLEKGEVYDSMKDESVQAPFFDVEFSPNGKKLLGSVIGPADVILYDLQDRNNSIRLDAGQQHGSTIYAVTFGRNGSSVYSTGQDGWLKKWNLDGSLDSDIYHHPTHFFFDLDLSPLGDRLLLACSDGLLYELDTLGNIKREYKGSTNAIKFAAAYSEDGRYVSAGDRVGKAWLWYRTGELLQEYIGEPGMGVWESELSHDNRYLLTAGEDEKVKKWSTSGILLNRYGLENTHIINGHSWQKSAVEPLYELKLYGLGKRNNTMVYTVNGVVQDTLIENGEDVNFTSSLHGDLLFAQNIGDDLQLVLLDKTFKTLGEKVIEDGMKAMAADPTERIVYFDKGNKLMRWDVTSGQVEEYFSLHPSEGNINSITCSPRGSKIALGTTGGSLVVIDISGDMPYSVFEQHKAHGHRINSLAFSSNGQTLASGALDGSILVWDVQRKQRITEVSSLANGPIYGLSISVHNNGVLAYHSSKKALLYDLDNGFPVQEFRILNDEKNQVISASFTDDEQAVILQYIDGITRVWEIRESWQSFIESNDFEGLTAEELKAYVSEGIE